MRILVACEESQEVCKAFREKGHEAYSCDVQPCSGGHPEWHLQQDVIPLLKEKWDMIIAFPPCTYLSNAGACRLYPKKGQLDEERYQKGLEAKEFFMSFYNADCPRIAIENPVSSRIFEMPPHSQEIQPYMFGHPYTKKTRLWLKGLSPLTPYRFSRSCRSVCTRRYRTERQKQIRSGKARGGCEKQKQNISRHSKGNGRSVGVIYEKHHTSGSGTLLHLRQERLCGLLRTGRTPCIRSF